MSKTCHVLGIDTSNYKTSVAVADSSGNIVCDIREFLQVKTGERGLRQSDALFQHVKMLPVLMERVRGQFSGSFDAVAYSSRPRPADGSYMPVFLAGKCVAESISAALGIPVFAYSHQEGHIEAVKAFSPFADSSEVLACHFSGGTCELLRAAAVIGLRSHGAGSAYDIEIIGGSHDISFGQVIDRAGVMMGMDFPSGAYMDRKALAAGYSSKVLTPVKVKDAWINLSGIDTQMKNRIEDTAENETDPLIRELFERISDAVFRMLVQGAEKTGINRILMAGGVSASRFIRAHTERRARSVGLELFFDENDLSQDNAVGVAILGGKEIWG